MYNIVIPQCVCVTIGVIYVISLQWHYHHADDDATAVHHPPFTIHHTQQYSTLALLPVMSCCYPQIQFPSFCLKRTTFQHTPTTRNNKKLISSLVVHFFLRKNYTQHFQSAKINREKRNRLSSPRRRPTELKSFIYGLHFPL